MGRGNVVHLSLHSLSILILHRDHDRCGVHWLCENDLDQGRLEAEAAILADRADVAEEITRLKSHLDQLNASLDSDQPAGRKVEFLVQEMGREANTIASKTPLPKVSANIIDIKSELEKMRELAQNIE